MILRALKERLSAAISTALQYIAIWICPRVTRIARNTVSSTQTRSPAPTRYKNKQLLVDVSIISQQDAGTGIQRVVRSLVQEILLSPPPGFDVKLVKATRKRKYHYTQNYTTTSTHLKTESHTEEIVVSDGDIFLGLDLTSRIAPRRYREFFLWRTQGAQLVFVVYDLLPLSNPDWFTKRARSSFKKWFATLAIYSSAIFCISNSVAKETESTLRARFGFRPKNIPVNWFHLGSNLPNSEIRRHTNTKKMILMVGTIEPRKGHSLILETFEILWRQGRSETLMIVGRKGWNMQEFIDKLGSHPESNKRLIWLPNVSDTELEALYVSADGVIMASEGEGFGLPLVEAARYEIPIFLRDIDIFREIAGNFATYFFEKKSTALAGPLEQWLDSLENGSAISSSGMPIISWHDSYQTLKSHLIELNKSAENRYCSTDSI